MEEFYLEGTTSNLDLATTLANEKYKNIYPRSVLIQSSITFNPHFLYGTYTSPFADNSEFWNGVRDRKNKVEVKVYTGWIENRVQHEHYHYQEAYIQQEARTFFRRLIHYHLSYASRRYEDTFFPRGFFKTKVCICKVGTASEHLKNPGNPFESIFLHLPDESPSVRRTNWPRRTRPEMPNYDRLSKFWLEYSTLYSLQFN